MLVHMLVPENMYCHSDALSQPSRGNSQRQIAQNGV